MYTPTNLVNGDVLTAAHLNGAYSNGSVNIPRVTGDIAITATATLIVYQITTAFTHATGDNQTTEITHGSSYQTTLAPDTGYEVTSVTVTMGGTDITATAYSNGSVNIPRVTGDIAITATATLIVYRDIAITATATLINNTLGSGKLGTMHLGTRNVNT